MDSLCGEIYKGINVKRESAWKSLFDIYYVSLCNHGNRIIKKTEDVEDIVQDVFISLWNSDTNFSSENALKSYLYKSVTNNSLKYLRDKNSNDKKLELWLQFENECSEDVFSSVVQEEVIRKLKMIIERLPESRKKILLLSMEGKSGEEIAGLLNVSINTIKQQKYRAYKFIKEELGSSWIVAFIIYL